MASYQILMGIVLMAIVSKTQSVEFGPSYYNQPEPYDAHPKYSFQYSVKDDHTGDIKSQHEERDGDVVRGFYTLIEPDGRKRTVEYTSDAHNGFNAIVHYEGGAYHAAPAPRYTPATLPAIRYAPAPQPIYASAPRPIAYAPAPKYNSPSYQAHTSASVSTPHFSYQY